MRFDIITCLPDLFIGPLNQSIVKRAQEKGHLEIVIHNLRDFALNKYGQIDDYAYGGGAGMVLMPEPLANCLDGILNKRKYDAIIYTTPDGECHNQSQANQFSLMNNVIIICGHYKGIDQRIRDLYVTHEVSIGDYVLSGGELAAAVLVDSVGRLIPGVLNDETSALTDTFQDDLLAPPVYTRPESFRELKVPEILKSGDAAKIDEWRMQEAQKKTKERRPDLWQKINEGLED